MRILVLSDLHLELGMTLELSPNLNYDVAILAGDIHSPGTKAVYWARRESTFGGRPVLLVPGNHEFYRREIQAELREMKQVAEGSNVHVLDRETTVIGGVRFLGCTLWTDFLLPVRQPGGRGAQDDEVVADWRGCRRADGGGDTVRRRREVPSGLAVRAAQRVASEKRQR